MDWSEGAAVSMDAQAASTVHLPLNWGLEGGTVAVVNKLNQVISDAVEMKSGRDRKEEIKWVQMSK